MSQQPKAKGSKPSKRKAGAAAAQTQTSSIATDDRVVRPRTDQSVAVGSAGGPAAPTASSVAVPVVLSALMRLAVVERQLIMQGLDLNSLARFSSTCKQMRGEALHKEAGKFIPRCPPGPLTSADSWAHPSPLFRMHVPTRLSFDTSQASGELSFAERRGRILGAAGFSRITELWVIRDRWTEAWALDLLALPWIQSVSWVGVCSHPWLSRSVVQHALFALPQLTSLRLELTSDAAECELLESALSQASKVTAVYMVLHSSRALDLRMLRALPALSSLKLASPCYAPDEPLGPLVWSLPPTITELTLFRFSLEPVSTPRSALKTLFLRLPKLRSLHTDWGVWIAPLLQGMLDAGVVALPDLRRVQFVNGVKDDPDVLRRFLHRFTDVTVRFVFENRGWPVNPTGLSEAYRMGRWYGSWPRVEMQPAPTEGPPSPHASDDEAESDVEVGADPLADEAD